MIPGKKYTVEDMLGIARRRKWIILGPFVFVTATTVLVAWLLPDSYRSETLIQVVPQRIPESYVRSTVTSRIEDRLNSISQQILTRSRLEPVIDDFNLYPDDERPMEEVVGRMRRDIEVQVVRGNAFRVSYVSRDPRVARQVVSRLASFFIEENLRDREVMAEGTSQFLDSQLEEARGRLVEQEKRLQEYREANAGTLPSQVSSNLQALTNTEMQIQSLIDSINRDRERRLFLERLSADLDRLPAGEEPELETENATPANSDPTRLGPGSAAQQLAEARAVLTQLEQRLKPEHPDISRMKRLIATLEPKAEAEAEALRAAGSGSASPDAGGASQVRSAELKAELESLDRQISAKEAEEGALRRRAAQYQARLEAAPQRESELTELMRDYDTIRGVYLSLLAKREDSKIAANLERRQIGGQFKVLDPALVPERPSSPNRPLIDLLGALAGLGLGVGLVALLEYRDTSLRSEADVVLTLALPVLATVPVISTREDRIRQGRRRFTLTVAALGTFALCVAAALAVWQLDLMT